MEVPTRMKFDELQQTTYDFGRRIVGRTSVNSGSVNGFYSSVDGPLVSTNSNDFLLSTNADLGDPGSSTNHLSDVNDGNNAS